MKKKILVILTMICLIFAVTACNGSGDDILGQKPDATVAPKDINDGINIEDPETFGHDNGKEILGFFIGIEGNLFKLKAMGEEHSVIIPEGYQFTGPFGEIPEGKVVAAMYELKDGEKHLTGIEIVEQMA